MDWWSGRIKADIESVVKSGEGQWLLHEIEQMMKPDEPKKPREWTVCEKVLSTRCDGVGLHYTVSPGPPHKPVRVLELPEKPPESAHAPEPERKENP